MKCDRPDCDINCTHYTTGKDYEFASENLLLIPACLLIGFGVFNTSFCCIITGLAFAGVTYEISKIKNSIKNCNCWY